MTPTNQQSMVGRSMAIRSKEGWAPMALAPTSEQDATRGSFSLRLRGWLRQLGSIALSLVVSKPFDVGPRREAALLAGHGEAACAAARPNAGTETIVPFPSQFHAPLADLARDLKCRFATLGLSDPAPFLLRIEKGGRPRLWIDSMTYIEFLGTGYRAVAEDVFDVRITIEAGDIASIAGFVRHYIVARLDDLHAREVAS
ncbi:hypothetical protein C1M53_16290 [Mesorhizobium sp. Pch-S]|nr:hypothetical protein C1M53_16290 [Mesorhizobium sp. Pch-S]